jgi:hypothetical protein
MEIEKKPAENPDQTLQEILYQKHPIEPKPGK